MRRAFATRTSEEWLGLLLEKGIPASLLNSIDEAMDHPQLEYRHAVVELELAVAVGPRSWPAPTASTGFAAPTPGSHLRLEKTRRSVLRDLLGYDNTRIADLAASGAFGAGTSSGESAPGRRPRGSGRGARAPPGTDPRTRTRPIAGAGRGRGPEPARCQPLPGPVPPPSVAALHPGHGSVGDRARGRFRCRRGPGRFAGWSGCPSCRTVPWPRRRSSSPNGRYRVPDGVDDATAAAMFIAFTTAHVALFAARAPAARRDARRPRGCRRSRVGGGSAWSGHRGRGHRRLRQSGQTGSVPRAGCRCRRGFVGRRRRGPGARGDRRSWRRRGVRPGGRRGVSAVHPLRRPGWPDPGRRLRQWRDPRGQGQSRPLPELLVARCLCRGLLG